MTLQRVALVGWPAAGAVPTEKAGRVGYAVGLVVLRWNDSLQEHAAMHDDKTVSANRSRFDALAAQWDSPEHQRRAAAFLEALQARGIKLAGRTVLEYGCGTGLLTVLLAKEADRVLAVDISAGMLAQLGRKIATQGIDSITICEADLVAQPLDGVTCDLVVCAMVLHHVADVSAILTHFHAMLGPGGQLAILDLDADGGRFHGKEAEGVAHHGFERAALEALVHQAGFDAVEIATAHAMPKDGETFTIFLLTAHKPPVS